jgi:hypothetical protein
MTITEYLNSLPLLKGFNTLQTPILDIMHHETKVKNHCFIGNDNQKLIIRDRSFFVDQLAFKDHDDFLNHLELRSKVNNEIYDKMLEKALSVIKSSANNRIINGRQAPINFNGLNTITEYNYMFLPHHHKLKSKYNFRKLIDYFEIAIRAMKYSTTHLIVGIEGYKLLESISPYFKDMRLKNLQLSNNANDLGDIEILNSRINIIFAGFDYTHNQVITVKDDMIDMYLVDFSENGLTFALEIFPIMKKNEGTGITYFLKTAQWLCQNSENCCYKISQRV